MAWRVRAETSNDFIVVLPLTCSNVVDFTSIMLSKNACHLYRKHRTVNPVELRSKRLIIISGMSVMIVKPVT